MSAVRVIDEHLLTPVLVYSGSGGVFENELVLNTKDGLIKTIESGQLSLSVDINAISDQISKKYINEIVFNEHVASDPAQIGNFFNLASTPTDPASVQLWLNGQLLTYGDDYTVNNRLITMLTSPLAPEDKLVASYSRPITLKQYAFGERLTVANNQAALKNTPVSSNDVMIFLNGQLLLRGITNVSSDYCIEGQNIIFNLEVDSTDIVLSTYAYS